MAELTSQQIENLKKRLFERRGELEELINNAAEGAKPVLLDQPIGRLSRMDALQQQSMSQANRQVALQGLEQIKAAMHRIDSGSYGCCVECDEEIDLARLQARPEAPFCIDCQSARERKK